jgi:hypothetical protein
MAAGRGTTESTLRVNPISKFDKLLFPAMMAAADGKEDQPTSTVPRIIAFDLDDTLWHPEMVRGAGGSED